MARVASRSAGRSGLVALLTAIGAVATVEGVRGVVQGTRQVPGGGGAPATVDSEYRFYSAWYAVLGVLLLGAARRPEQEARLVRAGAGGFLTAAAGRLLSIRTAGPPSAPQRALLADELVLPPVLIGWQARVAGASGH
jgi:predicted anti-sigma-YlaC factor YlaD